MKPPSVEQWLRRKSPLCHPFEKGKTSALTKVGPDRHQYSGTRKVDARHPVPEPLPDTLRVAEAPDSVLKGDGVPQIPKAPPSTEELNQKFCQVELGKVDIETVSYTHLTLPTILLV